MHFLSFVLVEKHAHSSREWKHFLRSTLLILPPVITWSFMWPYLDEGRASFLFRVFSILVTILHLKWSWADLISSTRISLCTIWVICRIFPSAFRSWASRIIFSQAKKVRLLNLCIPQNYLSVFNLSSVACLYDGCKSTVVVSSWRPCRGSSYWQLINCLLGEVI